MSLRTTLRGLSTATAVVVLSVACTPDAEAPPPPTASTTAPTSAPTPPETSLERQTRLDFAAAEKSYRTFRTEYGRVLRAGGAKRPTKLMRQTAGGKYLKTFAEVTEAYDGLGKRAKGLERIAYVRPGGYSNASLEINVCEDNRGVTYLDKSSKVTGRGELRTARIEVRRRDGRWILWSGEGQEVALCE